ncbi:MAG: outer membrane beta-barrel protein [Terracidiphilus sp.]
MRLKFICAGLFLSVALPAFSQVAPSASQGGIPLSVGVAYSNYYTDWSGYESGPTAWVDWTFHRGPRLLNGLGIEAEGRDLNYARTGSQPLLREDTAEGGPMYHWRHFDRFEPYGKFLFGYGHIAFNDIYNPYYTHDSRTVIAPGGGAEYRVVRNVWVRADYEYQFWTDFFNHHALNPEGFTVGASYDLSHAHSQ